MRTIEDTDGKGLPGQSEIPAPAITAEEWNLARRAAAERITAPALKEEVTTVPGPASIAELARALKNDVDLIYEWMYSNVDYYCTYSTRKGALGALIDRSAGPFDQAMLMVKLLRQAGYTASYVVGTIRFTTAQLENLLGTQDTASVYPSVNVINAGGIPNTPTYDDAGNLLYIDMAHCWVQVAISGTNYVFDPSIKTYSYTTGVDIGTITGFDLAALLNDAQSGATITNDYIQNLNAEKIRNDFSQYASNLLEWIRANKFDAGMKDIIGGKEIQVLPPGPVRQTSLPYQAPGSDTTIYPGELDDQYRPMFNIHGGGLNTGNLYCDQYYGSRLTITFTTAADGKVIPSLKANGVVLATGTEQPQNTTIAIDTAVGFIAGWENGIYSDPNSIYFIALAYGPVSQSMVDYHRQILQQNIANGGASNDEDVLGESLAILFYMHSAQHNKCEEILSQLSSTTFAWFIWGGVVGYNSEYQGPYSDYIDGFRAVSKNGDYFTAVNAFIAANFLLSAFESGIMQQSFSTTGISTLRVLDIANRLGEKIFLANRYNWSSISPQLTNWDAWKSYLEFLSYGWTLMVNQDGATPIGSYHGGGWIETKPSLAMGFLITPPTFGGGNSQPVSKDDVVNDTAHVSQSTNSGALSPSGENISSDPVGLFSGNCYYNRTDLSVGSSVFPYSLQFSRSYNSDTRFSDGPLGLAWTHNFATSINAGTNGLRGCGEISPKEAVSAIATAYGLIQVSLFGQESFPNFLNSLIASTASLWLMDEITNNAITLNDGGQSRTFIKLVDGSYNPPPGYASTLVQNTNGTYALKNPQQQTWNFNAAGNLSTYVDPAGVTVSYSYDGNNRLTGVTNGFGQTLSFTYSGTRLASVSDGNGRSVSFTVNGSGNLSGFTDANGKTITYGYGLPGQLTQIFLPENPTTAIMTNAYDSLGRVMSQSGSNMGTTSFYFAGSRSEEVDPPGNRHIRYYNSLGTLVRDVNELGQETDFAYDGLNRLTTTTYPEQNTLELSYDNQNNVLTSSQIPKPGSSLANIVQSFTYDSSWNKVVSATDGVGNITSYSYDSAQGTLLTITRPTIGGLTPTIVFTYNSRGQVLSRTDETGIVDAFVYDTATEQLLSSTRDHGTGRLNLVTSFGYDAIGNVITATDARSNTTTFEFDNERRMTRRTEASPFSYVTSWQYNDNGWRASIQKQTGNPANPYQIWSWTYLANGMIQAVTDPAGNPLNYQYDTLARVTSRTDAEGRVWQFAYDPVSRVSTVTDPMSKVADVRTYTNNGMMASRQDARSNTTTYQYDGFDRLSQQIYPDTTFEQYTYAANNNVLTLLTRKGDTITNTYDVLARLSTRQPGSLPLQTMTYDLAGRRTAISTPVDSGNPASGSYGYSYDTAGRLVSQTMPSGDTVTYLLDANGNRTRLTWPDSYYAQYGYDELNRLTDVKLNGSSSAAVQFAYDQLSRRTQLSYENGCVSSYSYEPNDDMASLSHDFVGSSVTFAFDYNKVHQVIGLFVDDSDFLWEPSVSSMTSYSSANNLNQYPAVGGTSYSYNANGSLTGGLVTASYDPLNRLTQVVSGSTTNNYWYDPLNRQSQKSVNSAISKYLYDGQQLIARYDGSGNLVNRFVPGNRLDEVFVNIAGSTSTFLHSDRIGSVIAETDGSGGVLNKFAYSPFGATASVSSSGFGFTSQRYDAEIGLYNYKARYYAPAIGRFLQSDPLGYDAGDLNLYSYVGNDALNLTDSLGLQAVGPGACPMQAQQNKDQASVRYFDSLVHTGMVIYQNGTYYTINGMFSPDLWSPTGFDLAVNINPSNAEPVKPTIFGPWKAESYAGPPIPISSDQATQILNNARQLANNPQPYAPWPGVIGPATAGTSNQVTYTLSQNAGITPPSVPIIAPGYNFAPLGLPGSSPGTAANIATTVITTLSTAAAFLTGRR